MELPRSNHFSAFVDRRRHLPRVRVTRDEIKSVVVLTDPDHLPCEHSHADAIVQRRRNVRRLVLHPRFYVDRILPLDR